MSRHDQHTIRKGTGEKYWYVLAGYLAVGILVLGANVVALIQTRNPAIIGGTIATLLFVLSAGGLITYPALFKDAAYLRGTGSWQVRWWRYMLFGLGIPFVLFAGLSLGEIDAAALVGLGSHGFTAAAGSAHYLYQRHHRVGVP